MSWLIGALDRFCEIVGVYTYSGTGLWNYLDTRHNMREGWMMEAYDDNERLRGSLMELLDFKAVVVMAGRELQKNEDIYDILELDDQALLNRLIYHNMSRFCHRGLNGDVIHYNMIHNEWRPEHWMVPNRFGGLQEVLEMPGNAVLELLAHWVAQWIYIMKKEVDPKKYVSNEIRSYGFHEETAKKLKQALEVLDVDTEVIIKSG